MPSREPCGEQSEDYLQMIPATDMLSISGLPALALMGEAAKSRPVVVSN